MLTRRLQNQNEKGDTIVEVLICIAILGFVLSASYSLTTRNQISSQKTQERAVAVGKANEQLERLRAYLGNNPMASLTNNFCFNPAGVAVDQSAGGSSPNSDINADTITPPDLATRYKTDCFDTVVPFYRWSIWKPGATGVADDVGAAGTDTFVVTVRWETAGGGGQDEVKMFYTIYETP